MTHDEIKAMLDSISPTWTNQIHDRGGMGWQVEGVWEGIRGGFDRQEDAQFIAAAPDIVRQLLNELAEIKETEGWALSYARFCEVCARSGEKPDDFATFKAKMLEIKAKR